jgi:DNA repair exonuclease SbcCD ATPase subunit
MQLAQKAMDQAKEQRAEEFAPADWKTALQAWEDAHTLMSKQKYGEAGPLLLRAKSRFEKARDIARAKREDLRREIEGMQKTLDTRYASLKAGVESSKMSAAARKSLNETCKDIGQEIEKAKTQFDQGDYTQARSMVMTVMRRVYEAEKALEKSGTAAKS